MRSDGDDNERATSLIVQYFSVNFKMVCGRFADDDDDDDYNDTNPRYVRRRAHIRLREQEYSVLGCVTYFD